MNVIFLDIDGVLNSELFYREKHKKRWFKFNTYYWRIKAMFKWIFNGFKTKPISLMNYKIPKNFWTFDYTFKRLKTETDKNKWKWLIEFCEETNCKICISSVWKNHFKDINDWDRALTKIGFPENTFVGITGNGKTLRGTEIQEWIDINQPIEKYAIIDDDNDMLPEQMKNFFQTDNYIGLTPTILYKIKRHFLKEN